MLSDGATVTHFVISADLVLEQIHLLIETHESIFDGDTKDVARARGIRIDRSLSLEERERGSEKKETRVDDPTSMAEGAEQMNVGNSC